MSRRLVPVLGVVAATVLAVGGCGFDPSSIPVPGSTVGGPTYRVHIEFANALNLPARANVVADGVRVGNLVAITLIDPGPGRAGYVVADIDLGTSTRLPASTTAQLRQNTILGDIYIALTTGTAPNGASPNLADGATIPITQTRPAMQVEDTMAGLATFVRGGAISRMQDIVDQVNAALPEDPRDTARMAGVVAGDLTDVAAHLDRVHDFAAAAQADIDVIRSNAAILGELFSADGARQVTDATTSLVHLFDVFPAIADFARAIAWLTPLARSGDAAAAALLPLMFTGRPLDISAPSNVNRLVALLHDRILPFVEQGPKVNIADVQAVPAATVLARDERIAAIVAALRMVGAVR